MKIKIDEITEEGLSLDVTEEGKNIEALAGPARFSIVSPVKAHLDIRRSDGGIDVDGEMSVKVSFPCSRCLKDFESPVEARFTNRLDLGIPTSEREKELAREELEVTFIEGTELDTSLILMEEISLALPIKPLCMEGCKGLCPVCGANLNEGLCPCPGKERLDQRFAKLKGLKIK
ncbi:MAG: DUF177 domain-containing protein [Deltaproteobacteria bacterium]|nr:DUF177 domain-containing protein [Deltaproteobacteria bacterium]